MSKYKFQTGDIVTLNADVIGVTESGNLIIRFKSGVKVLVKASDINTVHPKIELDGIDKRKGN